MTAGDPDDMNLLAERLYVEYRKGISDRGYHLPSELPHMAAEAVNDHWIRGHEPAVIYYLPRRLSIGDTQLARVLLERGKCQVVAGLVGDESADRPVHELLDIAGQPKRLKKRPTLPRQQTLCTREQSQVP